MSTATSAGPARSKPVSGRSSSGQSAPWSALLGRFSLRDSPGWLISVGVHVLAMLLLLGIKFHIQAQAGVEVLNAFDDLPSETQFETTDIDQVGIGSEVTA